MAVLIEKKWDSKLFSEEDAYVTAAVLPSGKVLAAPGADVTHLRVEAKHWLEYGEEQMFKAIANIYRMPLNGDVWIIEDPQEARKIIQEAGLK